MIRPEEVYRIGKIGKPHGVKGEVSFMFDDDVFDRTDAEYLVLLVDGIFVPFFFEEYRFKSGETALMKFCDIETKEQAQELTGCEVFFPRCIADSDEESMTLHATSGFKLVDANCGTLIGTILSVDDMTENILFNVETPNGDEIMIPATDDFIIEVDMKKQEIKVDLPDGLVTLNV